VPDTNFNGRYAPQNARTFTGCTTICTMTRRYCIHCFSCRFASGLSPLSMLGGGIISTIILRNCCLVRVVAIALIPCAGWAVNGISQSTSCRDASTLCNLCALRAVTRLQLSMCLWQHVELAPCHAAYYCITITNYAINALDILRRGSYSWFLHGWRAPRHQELKLACWASCNAGTVPPLTPAGTA